MSQENLEGEDPEYGDEDTSEFYGDEDTSEYYGDEDTSEFYGDEETSEYDSDEETSEFYGDEDTSEYYGDEDTSEFYGDEDTSEFYGDEDTSELQFKEVTYDVVCTPPDCSPRVIILVEGELTTFVVDTGCQWSSVTPMQVKMWGLESLVTDAGVPDEDDSITLTVDLSGQYFQWNFYVCGIKDNLLGLELLSRFCCVLDLQENTLTFRYDRKAVCTEFMTTMANINGHDIEALIDTGTTIFVVMCLDDAKKLDLPLEDISSRKITYFETRQSGILQYRPDDVCIKSLGREICGFITICPSWSLNKDVILGILVLLDSVISFHKDGSYDIVMPNSNHGTGLKQKMYAFLVWIRRAIWGSRPATFKGFFSPILEYLRGQ